MPDLSRRNALRALVTGLGITMVAAETASAQTPRLTFHIYPSGKGFRWRLKSANGRNIASSGESYSTKASCRDAIERIQQGAATATIVEDSKAS